MNSPDIRIMLPQAQHFHNKGIFRRLIRHGSNFLVAMQKPVVVKLQAQCIAKSNYLYLINLTGPSTPNAGGRSIYLLIVMLTSLYKLYDRIVSFNKAIPNNYKHLNSFPIKRVISWVFPVLAAPNTTILNFVDISISLLIWNASICLKIN